MKKTNLFLILCLLMVDSSIGQQLIFSKKIKSLKNEENIFGLKLVESNNGFIFIGQWANYFGNQPTNWFVSKLNYGGDTLFTTTPNAGFKEGQRQYIGNSILNATGDFSFWGWQQGLWSGIDTANLHFLSVTGKNVGISKKSVFDGIFSDKCPITIADERKIDSTDLWATYEYSLYKYNATGNFGITKTNSWLMPKKYEFNMAIHPPNDTTGVTILLGKYEYNSENFFNIGKVVATSTSFIIPFKTIEKFSVGETFFVDDTSFIVNGQHQDSLFEAKYDTSLSLVSRFTIPPALDSINGNTPMSIVTYKTAKIPGINKTAFVVQYFNPVKSTMKTVLYIVNSNSNHYTAYNLDSKYYPHCIYLTANGMLLIAYYFQGAYMLDEIDISNWLNVTNIASVGQLRIYPNPSHDELTIEIPGNGKAYKLQVTDMAGKTLREEKIGNGGGQYQFERKGIKAGIYLFTLTDEQGGLYSAKVVLE